MGQLPDIITWSDCVQIEKFKNFFPTELDEDHYYVRIIGLSFHFNPIRASWKYLILPKMGPLGPGPHNGDSQTGLFIINSTISDVLLMSWLMKLNLGVQSARPSGQQ